MSGLLPHGLSWPDSERSVWKLEYCEGERREERDDPKTVTADSGCSATAL